MRKYFRLQVYMFQSKPQCNKFLLPFFFFFFFSSSRLLSFSIALISSLFCWTIAMWFLFLCFVSYLKFLKPFYTLEMLKTLYFFNERWAEWFSLSFFFFSVLSPTLCDALIASHQWKLFFFIFLFFLSSNFLVFNIKKCTEMTYYINIFLKNVYYQYYYYWEWYFKFEIWHN